MPTLHFISPPPFSPPTLSHSSHSRVQQKEGQDDTATCVHQFSATLRAGRVHPPPQSCMFPKVNLPVASAEGVCDTATLG